MTSTYLVTRNSTSISILVAPPETILRLLDHLRELRVRDQMEVTHITPPQPSSSSSLSPGGNWPSGDFT